VSGGDGAELRTYDEPHLQAESSTGGLASRSSGTVKIPPGGILAEMDPVAARKKELQDRLRRIEGQIRGLQRMVERDQYCIDILTQLNSATAALKAVGIGLLDEQVRRCVRDGDAGKDRVEELLTAVARFAR
jgi:DNA-binding FrmR family transcriptional regulator